MQAATAFQALGEDTRLRIVELLADGERSAGGLATEFAISRPAVSRHLRVLREAGLVQWRDDAQRRMYRLDTATLEEVAHWVEDVRRAWATRLDLLERHLDSNVHDAE